MDEIQNVDYKEIPLDTTGIFSQYYDFSEWFRKNNITTVGQALDATLMDTLIKQPYYKTVYKQELKGFINLLKFKYKGELFDTNSIMNKSIIKNNEKASIMALGFSRSYEHTYFSAMDKALEEGLIESSISIYEFFRFLVSYDYLLNFNANANPIELIKICIIVYQLNNIEELKNRLQYLELERKKIDDEIQKIKAIIDDCKNQNEEKTSGRGI